MSRVIIIMGVAGCGKSTIGAALAKVSDAGFIDGDDLHPAANRAKMTAGTPLTDDDRWPWLERIGQTFAEADGDLIIACSALKRIYRDHITKVSGCRVLFVHLAGSPQLISARMAARQGHFMPTALLDSQFATLEPPEDNEYALTQEIDMPPEDIISGLQDKLRNL